MFSNSFRSFVILRRFIERVVRTWEWRWGGADLVLTKLDLCGRPDCKYSGIAIALRRQTWSLILLSFPHIRYIVHVLPPPSRLGSNRKMCVYVFVYKTRNVWRRFLFRCSSPPPPNSLVVSNRLPVEEFLRRRYDLLLSPRHRAVFQTDFICVSFRFIITGLVVRSALPCALLLPGTSARAMVVLVTLEPTVSFSFFVFSKKTNNGSFMLIPPNHQIDNEYILEINNNSL